MTRLALALTAACAAAVAGAGAAWAQANNDPPPSGPVILDLNGTPIPHAYQLYTVSFTAAQTTTNLSFALREDPAYLSLDNVTMVNTTTHSGNLVLNGDFSLGPVGANQPTDWSYLNVFGAYAGGVVRAGCGTSGGNCYYDGAVQAYDAITQSITTVVGDVYTVSFDLTDNGPYSTFSSLSTNGDTTDTDGNGVDLVVYAGNIPTRSGSNIDTAQPYYLASNVGTTVNPVFVGGTLRTDQAGGSYAFNFTLDGSGTNTIDQYGNNSTFSGVFSNATAGTPGGIIFANSLTGGSVTFTGINTYTGLTTINSGATLALAGSGSIATSSGVVDNGTFSIAGTTAGASITTLSDTSAAPGTVRLGAETLTLTDASGKFYGNIAGTAGSGLVIGGGSEALDGTLSASFLTVQSGATLRGYGSINAPTTVYGTVDPGSYSAGVGTLSFSQPLVLSSGSTSRFRITGSNTGDYGNIAVTGANNTAAVNGTLEPWLYVSGSGSLSCIPVIGEQFLVVETQAGVTGSYTSLTQPDGLRPGTRFDAIYTPDDLFLVVTPSYYGRLEWAGLPETANETAVGNALDEIRPYAGLRMNSDLSSLFYPLYGLSGPDIPPALNLLAPTIYADGLMAARNSFYQMSDSITDQLAARRSGWTSGQTAPGPLGSIYWMNGVGQFSDVSGSGTPSYHSTLGGAIAGMDFPVLPGTRLGFAVGGGSIYTNSNGASDTGTALQLSVYGGWQSGMFFLDGQGSYFHVDQTIDRYLDVWNTKAGGNDRLDGGGGQINAGLRLNWRQWHFEPTLGISGLSLSGGSFTESTGGPLAEHIGNQSINSVQSMLGVRIGTQFPLTPTVPMQVHAILGWQHEFDDIMAHSSATFLAGGMGAYPFTVANAPMARDMARIGVGFDVKVSQMVSLYGSYEAGLGQNTSQQYLAGGVRMSF